MGGSRRTKEDNEGRLKFIMSHLLTLPLLGLVVLCSSSVVLVSLSATMTFLVRCVLKKTCALQILWAFTKFSYCLELHGMSKNNALCRSSECSQSLFTIYNYQKCPKIPCCLETWIILECFVAKSLTPFQCFSMSGKIEWKCTSPLVPLRCCP